MSTKTIYNQRDWLQDIHGDPLPEDVCRPREFTVAPAGAWLDTSEGGWRSEINVSGRLVRMVYSGNAADAARWEVI